MDKAFLGVNGLSADFGLSAPNVFTAESRRAIIAASRMRIALADHSKLGVESLSASPRSTRWTMLVTDSDATPEQLDPIREMGIEVLVAE